MNKDAIHKLEEKIGSVKEVKTNEIGECLGQFARVRVSIDITQPSKNVVFLQQEEERIPIPDYMKKFPDLCFCCAHIGHQYIERLKYKGQQKEELPYRGWMRAATQAKNSKEELNQRKGKSRIKSKCHINKLLKVTTSSTQPNWAKWARSKSIG